MEAKTIIKITALLSITYYLSLQVFGKYVDVDTYRLCVLLIISLTISILYIRYKLSTPQKVNHHKLECDDISKLSDSMQIFSKKLCQVISKVNTTPQQNCCHLTTDEIHSRATTLVKLLMPEDELQYSGESCVKLMKSCNTIVRNISDKDWSIFIEMEQYKRHMKFKHSLVSLSDIDDDTEEIY